MRYGLEVHSRLARSRSDFSADRAVNIDHGDLWVLPAAEVTSLAPLHLRKCLAALQERFEHLILVAPPLNVYSEGLVFGQLTNGVVMVLKAHATLRIAALKARQTLESNKVPLLGAVLNEAQTANPVQVWKKLPHLASALTGRKAKERREARPDGNYTGPVNGPVNNTHGSAIPILSGGDHEC
jgi:MinD-like ATPase involved in chromosome partitioning or flagellar assembly